MSLVCPIGIGIMVFNVFISAIELKIKILILNLKGLGFILPSWLVQNYTSTSEYEKGRDDVGKLMIYMSIAGISSTILLLILYKKKPLAPPSKTGEDIKFPFKDQVNTIRKNKSYILLMFSYMIIIGNVNAICSCVGIIITPFGLTKADAVFFKNNFLLKICFG